MNRPHTKSFARPAGMVAAFALALFGLSTLVGPSTSNAQGAGCGLPGAAFCDDFNQGRSSVRGRAGDLDPTKWSVGRLAPSDFSWGGAVNPVAAAPIPSCRSSFTQTSVYPPDDTLICDPSGTRSAQLMTAVTIQNYGNNSYMIRQPFDFASRTGKIVFDVDLWGKTLGTYVAVDITEDPVPAPTFREFDNYETGPVPRSGLAIHFQNVCDPDVAVGKMYAYSNFVQSEVQPTFSVSGTGCVKIAQGSLNHVEIRLSRTQVEVYASDFSTDNGQSFPNFRRLYAAPLNLTFMRGYVHMAARNHASIKYGLGPVGVYHWDNIAFDGPVITNYRAYEIADNRTIGTYAGQTVMNLGWVLLDGTTGRAAGMYDPANRVSSLPFQGVDVTSATGARVSLNAFVNANNYSHTATTAWGWQYRFNGGTWRTRLLTAAEAQAANTVGSAGNLTLAFDVPVGDLRAGTNTFEMLGVNLPMDIPPAVANIDLIVSLPSNLPPPPPPPANLRIIR